MMRGSAAWPWLLVLSLAVACGGRSSSSSPVPVGPSRTLNVLGIYSLTFSASPSCSLPSEVSTFTFTQAYLIELSPGVVRVDLNTRNPCMCSPGFTGTRANDEFRFEIVGGSPGQDGVTSDILADGDGREVRYDGVASADRTDKRIAGVFSGRISIVKSSTGTVLAACEASDHKIDFRQ